MLILTVSRFSCALNQSQIDKAMNVTAKIEQVKQSTAPRDDKKKKNPPTPKSEK